MAVKGTMTGRVFGGRYHIEDRIGVGGMAEVYRAQDDVLSRLVAVKVMLPQYASDPDFTRRFRQEAAAAANLSSPYIVNVYDWGEEGGTYYIVMEYVRGSDLKTAIKQRGAVNQRKVAEIGSQVCQALAVAHNMDIIHRDIKPQNIMIQPDGNVKVMDFGIAHAKNSVKEQTTSVLGTAHYISPEQAQGKELTAASDIYSLGVVLYEASTGKLPFDGPDAVSVAMMQVSDQPVPPREINPVISPDLEAIIMCAMAKNPSERFATANDMRAALNDFLAGRPLKGLGVASMNNAETHAINGNGFTSAETRMMSGVAAGAAGGAMMTSVMPPAQGGMVDATQALQGGSGRGGTPTGYRASTKPPKHTGRTVAIVIAILAALAVIGGVAFAFLGGGGEGEPVPDVVGKTLDEATQTLQAAGFDVGTIDNGFDESVPVGSVIKQDPAADSLRPKGTAINITISQGPEMVRVPDLSKKTAEEARADLEKLGLVASAGNPEYSNDVEKGLVIRQDPAANSEVNKGTVVTYVLSLGPDIIAIPDVTGYAQADAEKALTDAGFNVNVVSAGYSDSVKAGNVVKQDPSANSRLEQGGTVTIYISEGPEPVQEVPVPNVIGLSEEAAIGQLDLAGFSYEVMEQASADYEAGTVCGQEPGPDMTIPVTEVVIIYVSTGPGTATQGETA